MLTPPLSNRSRWRLAKSHAAGILHHCVPTLVLGIIFRFRARRSDADRGPQEDPGSVKSIVVFRLDRIGDLVLASAMLRELRRMYENARITLVVTTATQCLVEYCPYVDEILTVAPSSGKLTSFFSELCSTLAFCRRWLCSPSGGWDLAINPRWDTDSHFAAVMACYTGAPRRIGFSERCSPLKSRVNWHFDALYTEVLAPGPLKHEVERNLDIVRHLGGRVGHSDLELWLTRADQEDATRRRADFGLSPGDLVIAFGVGASHPRRRWPAPRFAELIDLLRMDLTFTPAIICGPDELPIAREVQDGTCARILMLDNPSLRQTAAFLSRCTVFVGNDSGPVHIAAAAGLPVVAISCHPLDGDPGHEQSPNRFGPFTEQRVILRPIHAVGSCKEACTSDEPHCIAHVPASHVANAALSLLGQHSGVERQVIESLPYGD